MCDSLHGEYDGFVTSVAGPSSFQEAWSVSDHVAHVSVAALRDAMRTCPVSAIGELIRAHEEDPRPGVRSAVRSALLRQERHLAEQERLADLYKFESDLRGASFALVAGIDEVGRGAIAGPLSAGACVLPPEPRIEGLDDSKRLSPRRRYELDVQIREVAVACAVAHVPASDVDTMGVTAALKRAMREALAMLRIDVLHVVIDGLPMGIHPGETAVVKGDSRVAAVAAASVIAKVERDALMSSLAQDHPVYGFEVNKGYGTVDHFRAIEAHGPSALHRLTFCRGAGTDSLF